MPGAGKKFQSFGAQRRRNILEVMNRPKTARQAQEIRS